MSAGFEAAPRVVESRSKYREEDDEERLALNIMYDKRVFRGNTHNMNMIAKNMTPAQQEELRVKEEREKKKVEMIKRQLIEFKKKTHKGEETLYDLRPGPPARIEVDLTYFLTEQGKDEGPDWQTVVAQTDAFLPKPPTPKYIPKKTGIDAETQIGDYDLFYYDDAVLPILNVVVDKTLESALLEVEEESELKAIDKYKKECERKKQKEKDEWKQEIKTEKARLKQKNELLEAARKKKRKMIETSHKLQRLNIAKAFLQNTFTNSLQFLSDSKYWRDNFEDQLKSDYKEHLLSGIQQLLLNEENGKQVCNTLCDAKFDQFAKTTDPIKKNHDYNLSQKNKIRMIENPNKRTVNFMFVNPFPVRLNEFSHRLRKYFDNKLDDYVTDLDSRIHTYIEKVKNDELEEDENEPISYPITYSRTPFTTFDVSAVGRIALATADDPFFKLPPTHKKYFPELIVYNKNGEIIETIDESKAGTETETKGVFDANWRDNKLKVNDDRKSSISLLLQKDVQMVLLVVKSKDLADQPDVKNEEFDRAQFRFIDDETNQTLDQAKIKDIKLTMPTPEGEGDEEEAPAEPEPEEEGEENKEFKPQNVIIVGRIHLENDRWIYEQYHYMYKEDKHQDLFEKIGKIETESRNYFKDKEDQIKEEESLLKESKEAAAQAAAAKAASKQKNKKKGTDKKKKDDKEEEKAEEEEPVAEENKVDIEHMPGFKQAIEDIHSTVFGPVSFELSENKWDQKKAMDMVEKKMKDELGEKLKDCIHGFEFKVAGKVGAPSRKRILKASRNAQNLKILPVIPPEIETQETKPEGEGQGEGEEENDE